MKNKLFISLFLVLVLASQSLAFNNNFKWQFEADNSISGGVAVSGNTVLFGDLEGKFYALDKTSGSVLWKRPGRSSAYEFYGTPAVTSKGNVVFAQSDGTITVLKIEDGRLAWRYSPKGEESNEAPNDGAAAGDGLVFIAKSDAKLYAINENNGRTAWTYQAGDQGLRTAPSYSNGIVFLGEYDGIFSMIDAKSGKRLNGGGAGGAVNTPTVKDGIVYFSAWDGAVNAVKVKGVIPKWEVNVNDTVTTSPVIDKGTVAVGTGRGKVIGLNASNGFILWNYETQGGGISRSLLAGDGVVIAGSDQGEIFVFNSKTGSLINKINTEHGMSTDGAFSDGVFYIASGNTLYAVE